MNYLGIQIFPFIWTGGTKNGGSSFLVTVHWNTPPNQVQVATQMVAHQTNTDNEYVIAMYCLC